MRLPPLHLCDLARHCDKDQRFRRTESRARHQEEIKDTEGTSSGKEDDTRGAAAGSRQNRVFKRAVVAAVSAEGGKGEEDGAAQDNVQRSVSRLVALD